MQFNFKLFARGENVELQFISSQCTLDISKTLEDPIISL